MNTYECINCKTQYKSDLPVCKLTCPKCSSKNHKLIKIHHKDKFKF